jgi:hypothetical protein
MEVSASALAPVEEDGELLHVRLRNFLEFRGREALPQPDDVEALESCQLGFAADGVLYNDISRGMCGEATTVDELHIRSFWRQCHAQMTERDIADWADAPAVAARVSPAFAGFRGGRARRPATRPRSQGRVAAGRRRGRRREVRLLRGLE